MTATPTEFYAAYRLFLAHEIRARADAWGMLTDGFSDMSEAIEAITESFKPQHWSLGYEPRTTPDLTNTKVVKINLEDGTSRDVTEDVIAAIAAMQEAAE